MKKIAVLMGGTSSEREVSLQSGRNVADALESTGKFEVVRVSLEEDSLDAMPRDIDAAYIALHGGWGESGGVQAALDALGIPYTGPGAEASRLAMDKIASKKAFDRAGIPNAHWAVASSAALPPPLAYPCVVKPPRNGSSVGVSKATDDATYMKAVQLALKLDGFEALIEEFIPGREMSVGIIDGEALPAIEIVAPGGWYGYAEKYESQETRYPFLEGEDELAARLRHLAIASYEAIGCRGVTRVDFRVNESGEPYVLELNTSPGFTSHSLVPKAGMKTGLSFAGVCERILACAAHD